MVDHSSMKLGKRRARIDSRTLKLGKYLTEELPEPPSVVDNAVGFSAWGMMLNDALGDCTCAAAGHFEQVATLNVGPPFTPSDSDILAAYEAVGGYQPGNPSTDNGAVEIDVLNYWRKTGIAGKKIFGYADPDVKNRLHVKQSIYLFGAVYIGVALPLTAQSQDVWDVVQTAFFWDKVKKVFGASDPTEPWSWGGHAVICPIYNLTGPVCVTWGALKQMTWAFWDKYVDEAHAVLLPDWVGDKDKTPQGFDMATLQQDLAVVAN